MKYRLDFMLGNLRSLGASGQGGGEKKLPRVKTVDMEAKNQPWGFNFLDMNVITEILFMEFGAMG